MCVCCVLEITLSGIVGFIVLKNVDWITKSFSNIKSIRNLNSDSKKKSIISNESNPFIYQMYV